MIFLHTKSAYNSNNNSNRALYINSCGKRTVGNSRISINRRRGRSDYLLVYVMQGQAHFVLNRKKETLSAGQFFLFRPNQPQYYGYTPNDKAVVFWLHFSGTDAEKILNTYNLSESIFKTGVKQEFENYFTTIINEILDQNDNYQDIIQNLLKNIFALISRYSFKISTTVKEDNYQIGGGTREIYNVINYFDNHYTENININELVKNKLNVSHSWFIRKFKTATEMTPIEYINNLRIENAKALLENSTYNITEIANRVGFNDALYFSRYFKKKTGISPLKYRKTCV